MNADTDITIAAVAAIAKNIKIIHTMIIHKNGFNGIIDCRRDFYG